jgi:hypothetical protein
MLVIITANFVPSSIILVTLMMKAMRSSETSALIRATRLNTPGDGILHSHPVKISNLKHWIKLANDYVESRTLTDTIMNFLVP